MRLTNAAVDRYGPLFDCRPPCGDGVTVLSGPNEAGKTLYLEAVLQLLEPELATVMNPPPRVTEPPAGRVTVEIGGEQYDCGGETSLSDISEIEPSHLQSVFVVRDTDLELPAEQEYYTSLIQKLGDIHTTEINAIQAELTDRGRLTPTNHNVSRSETHDNAGSVRDDARTLAADIREYAAQIEEAGLDELDARRLRYKRRLREATAALETLREAETVAEHAYLSRQLDTYRDASAQLAALEAFDRETLEELRDRQRDIEQTRARVDELDTELERQKTRIHEADGELETLEDRAVALDRREPAVGDARAALSTYRERQAEATGADRSRSLAKHATIAGVLAAGAAGVAGASTGSNPAVALGVGLLVVAVVSGLGYRRSNRRLAARESAREAVLQAARDAGFEVSAVADVAPAIESFESELERVRKRVAKTEQELQSADTRLQSLEEERAGAASEIEDLRRTRERRLAEVDVESIGEYETCVTRREELAPEQRTANQSLVDRFGDPDADDPTARADAWQRSLDALVAEIDMDAVSAEAYDEEELAELDDRVAALESELEVLEARLADHDDQLDAFDDRAGELRTRPFVGQRLALDSRSRDGLEALAAELDGVVEAIEVDAELSRKALALFDRIAAEEEQKLSTLFAPDGPASATFETLTGGRYTEVAYDADAHEIAVERSDGRTFCPAALSQGTTDQLYFATRVSLATQLLGNEPGFLLLDDPFLAADPARLRRGFETLQALAADGWQVLYLTAKQEVSQTMVEEFDLAHAEMAPTSFSSSPG
jgi:DNA repair exonuclease SbcCD ATPase subunit